MPAPTAPYSVNTNLNKTPCVYVNVEPSVSEHTRTHNPQRSPWSRSGSEHRDGEGRIFAVGLGRLPSLVILKMNSIKNFLKRKKMVWTPEALPDFSIPQVHLFGIFMRPAQTAGGLFCDQSWLSEEQRCGLRVRVPEIWPEFLCFWLSSPGCLERKGCVAPAVLQLQWGQNNTDECQVSQDFV